MSAGAGQDQAAASFGRQLFASVFLFV